MVWCLWSVQSKRNVLYSGTKPGQTEWDKVALLQRAQLLLTFRHHDDPTLGFLKARSQEQFIKTTKKSGDTTRWETAWKHLEQNPVSPSRQQAAVLWNQPGSWLWMWSLLSSQRSVLGVTLLVWLGYRGCHPLSCFQKGRNRSAPRASSYYWILLWNYDK